MICSRGTTKSRCGGPVTAAPACHGRLLPVTRQPIGQCPCCGYRTGCATCPVCFWTDDSQTTDASQTTDDSQAMEAGGPNGAESPNGDVTLADAQLNFLTYGA